MSEYCSKPVQPLMSLMCAKTFRKDHEPLVKDTPGFNAAVAELPIRMIPDCHNLLEGQAHMSVGCS